MSLFNSCIITTSSESVAKMYRELILKRVNHGIYPVEIDFRVYSDNTPNSPGSGGAMLLALKRYSEETGRDFDNEKILLINAGGTRSFIPSFSPEGPLFTPLPLDSSSVISPVVLDLHLNLFLKYPWNSGELVICPDNIIVDFDTASVTEMRGDICGFSVSSSFENGANHGVYKFDSFRTQVVNYFQKVDPVTLRLRAALEGTGECAVDIGIISLSSNFVKSFLQTVHIQHRAGTLLEAITSGAASFDLYLEVITATLSGIDFETYQKAVASRSKLDNTTLQNIYTIFSKFTLKALLTRSATFNHLRTAEDYLEACNGLRHREARLFYNSDIDEIRPFCSPELMSFNSIQLNIPLGKHKTVIAESLQRCTIDNLLGANIITGLTEWNFDGIIPEGICIEQRRVDNQTVKVIYSIYDMVKTSTDTVKPLFCGIQLTQWLSDRKLKPEDIWEERDPKDFLHAHLFTTDFSDEFLAGYWSIPLGEQWSAKFRSVRKFSLRELDSLANILDRDLNRQHIRTEVLKRQILSGKGWTTASYNDFKLAFSNNPPVQTLQQIYQSTADYLLKSYRKSHLESISDKVLDLEKPVFITDDQTGKELLPVFSDTVMHDRIIIGDCPLRIDLAGGWTDLPPFTLQNGGAVVNVAVDLNGKPPLQVFCKIIKEPYIKLISIDNGTNDTISSFEDLNENHGFSDFKIHKAVLRSIGFSKDLHSGTLVDFFRKRGFGIQLSTLCTVPYGSGLGSSSILAAAMLSVLYRVFNRTIDSQKMLNTVIGIEQALNYGGGWQDLLGGVFGGVKYIQSKPGLRPQPVVYQLNSSALEDQIKSGIFTLYYTGINRQSTSVTETVSRQMSRNIPSYLFTLRYLKVLAADARTAIETSNLRALAEILNASNLENQRVMPIVSDSNLKMLLESGAGLYSAFKFSGAGGGGFALFVSETEEKADILRNFLLKKTQSGAKIVPFSLNSTGLTIAVI